MDIALHLPVNSLEPEVLALLRTACQLFTGSHDFYSFSRFGDYSFVEVFPQISVRNEFPDYFFVFAFVDGFDEFICRFNESFTV